jgi:hypothetical protein
MSKPARISLLIGTFILSNVDSVKNFSINSFFSDNSEDDKKTSEEREIEKFKKDVRSKILCEKNDQLCWK